MLRGILYGLLVIMLFAVLGVVLMGLGGCRQKKPPLEQTKNERTVTGGHANTVTGHKQGMAAMKSMRGTTVSDKQIGYISMAESAFDLMKSGGDEMYAACKEALERVSAAAEKRGVVLNGMMFWGIGILAAGAAVMSLGGKLPWASLAGGALAIFGSILGAAGFGLQLVEPWARIGLSVLVVLSVGVIVFRVVYQQIRLVKKQREADAMEAEIRAKAYEIRAQDEELRVEKVVTKELVQTIDDIKPALPEFVRKEKFGDEVRKGTVSEIQSAPTEAKVAEARAEIRAEKQGNGGIAPAT